MRATVAILRPYRTHNPLVAGSNPAGPILTLLLLATYGNCMARVIGLCPGVCLNVKPVQAARFKVLVDKISGR